MNRKLRVEELNRPDIEEFKLLEKLPVTIVLDNIRSFHNVGSIFRTADAFRFREILLCGITPVPPHREINKTALGATESMNWKHEQDVFEVVQRLYNQKTTIITLEQTENSIKLQDFKIDLRDENYALVMGNEVFGVDQKVIEKSTNIIEIPQEGTKHSLNVSVSSGMLMWEIYKQLRF